LRVGDSSLARNANTATLRHSPPIATATNFGLLARDNCYYPQPCRLRLPTVTPQ